MKAKFGVKVSVSEIKLADNSAHKSEYLVGETFDTTGLVIMVVYDDYSTETVYGENVTLVTGALNKYSKYIEVSYEGKKTRIPVTVTAEVKPEPPVDSSEESEVESEESDSEVSSESVSSSSSSSSNATGTASGKKGCGGVISGMACGVVALAVCAAVLLKKKED